MAQESVKQTFLISLPKIRVSIDFESVKQIIRVSIDLVEFGSGFDQADISLTVNPKLGLAHAFAEEFESTVFQLTVTLF